ncbi:hypothetical protein [Streptomyces sp. NPDC020330]|uniref:hypothetical protein n=1 Tax=unclassified Streptomyces TaxID=2593676 RepID=UPI00378CEB7B
MVTGAYTVLALEFRGVGDRADFGFLTREVDGVDLTRVDPLVHHVEQPLGLAEQASLLAEALPNAPALVLAYCGTAALALHVAELTGAPSLLVDPYPVTADDMRRDFIGLCESTGVDPTGLVDPAADPDPARWAKELYRARDAMAAPHGGDDVAYELVDDMLDRYRAWLRFLQASRSAAPAAPGGAVTAITARPDPRLGLLLVDSGVAQVHRVEGGTGILDSPEVRGLLAAAVERHRPASDAPGEPAAVDFRDGG